MNTNKLTVNFNKLHGGWIEFTIKYDEQFFDGQFSVVYNPLMDLKHWLEAIATGVQQTSFVYDREGAYIKFDFEQDYYDNQMKFTVSEPDNEDEQIFINCKTTRRKIIKDIYLGLLNFAASDTIKVKWIEEKRNGYEWIDIADFRSDIVGRYLGLDVAE